MCDLVPAAEPDPPTGVLERGIGSFVEALSRRGYRAVTIRYKRRTAARFARWVVRRRLDVAKIDETTVRVFLAREGCGRNRGDPRTLRDLLEHLRSTGVTSRREPETPRSPQALLQAQYATYLRVERALDEATISQYLRWSSGLLGEYYSEGGPAPHFAVSVHDVADFLLRHSRGLAPRTVRSIVCALRSFLRFLFLRGDTQVDLALSFPTVRRWRRTAVHPYLRPDEVERMLATCDRATVVGRRDHAILLLLARLGLRACEVASLRLEDVHWRSGEIVVHGKGKSVQRLPLLPEVGAAVALYLQDARPRSECRNVFLRVQAPRVGLHAGAIGPIARHALVRAGLHPPRAGSHVLRHSLATTMIRSGASMAEIAEVLGHRSPETTETYAKVDFESLRAVALPWPGSGGAL